VSLLLSVSNAWRTAEDTRIFVKFNIRECTGFEEFYLLGYNAVTPCETQPTFWRVTCRLHLQSRSISQARNQRESRWQAELCLISCLAYASNLKIEATCSSETSVDFERTTRRYIPEDKTLHNHRCENLVSTGFAGIF
jgi:hypothetical protein